MGLSKFANEASASGSQAPSSDGTNQVPVVEQLISSGPASSAAQVSEGSPNVAQATPKLTYRGFTLLTKNEAVASQVAQDSSLQNEKMKEGVAPVHKRSTNRQSVSAKPTSPRRRLSGSPVASTSSSLPSSSTRPQRAVTGTVARKRAQMSPSPTRLDSARSQSCPRVKQQKLHPNVMVWDRKRYNEESRKWFTEACVRSKAKELNNKGKVPPAIFDLIMARTIDQEEPNCYAKVVPLDIQMPCTDDYRGLDSSVKQELISAHIPMPHKDTLSNSEKFDLQPINFTGHNYMDIQKAKGQAIVNRVKKHGRQSVAELLTREKKLILVGKSYAKKAIVDQEAEKIVGNLDELKELRQGTLPVFTLHVNTMEEFESAQETIESSSICLIEGSIEACKFDSSKFSPDVLAHLQSDYAIMGPRQMPQSMRFNFPRLAYNGKPCPSNSWLCPDTQHKIRFPKFIKYFKEVNKTSEDAVSRIVQDPAQIEDILTVLSSELTKLTLPLPSSDRGFPGALTIAFGSNIDIEQCRYESGERKFEEQHQNVAKFPAFVRPDFNYSLLDYCGTYMSGINTPQLYMKVPGVRTSAHLENGCLASINLNLGPGSSMWYSVPLEFAGQFQELAKVKNGLSDRPHERFFEYGFWPNEEDCLAAGIPLQKFEQKEGAMVYVGVGSYHWVQANEFTIQVSWNCGPSSFRQLSWLAISHDNYLANLHPPLVPLETLIWGLAEAEGTNRAVDMESRMRLVVKTMLMRSLANCQSQRMFAENMKLDIELVTADSPVDNVGRCCVKKCRQWTFNCFLKEKEDTIDERKFNQDVYCLSCALRLKMLQNPAYQCYQRHSIEKLVEMFDQFSLSPGAPHPDGKNRKWPEEEDESLLENEDSDAP